MKVHPYVTHIVTPLYVNDSSLWAFSHHYLFALHLFQLGFHYSCLARTLGHGLYWWRIHSNDTKNKTDTHTHNVGACLIVLLVIQTYAPNAHLMNLMGLGNGFPYPNDQFIIGFP